VAFATQHLKAKKIAYVAHDDAYGAWNVEAANFMAKRAGAEVNVQLVAANINDVTAPMLKLKAGNPDALVIATYTRGAAMLIKKAYELGLNKPIVLLVNGSSDLKQLVETVGTKDAFKNTYVQNNFADLPGGPKLKWAYDLYAKTYPELAAKPGHPQAYMPQGIPSAMAVIAALKAAGPDLTRQKFLAQMEKLNLDTGVMAGPIVFGPNDRVAMEHMTYARFDGGALSAIPGSFASEWRYSAK
jgi:branched-chain amino acid transport system substrate-binding protein